METLMKISQTKVQENTFAADSDMADEKRFQWDGSSDAENIVDMYLHCGFNEHQMEIYSGEILY